jgi:proteasome lid subunit RPN8/RPN11
MNSFTRLGMQVFVSRRSGVRMKRTQWTELIAGLDERAEGVRESGAFLLSDVTGGSRVVRRVVYYDDLGPCSHNGGLWVRPPAYAKLWRLCSAEERKVIADLHTHPGDFTQLSPTDQMHPMVGTVGHIAIVVPRLARGPIEPRECGVHVYLGGHRWKSRFGRDAERFLCVGGRP